MREMPPGNSPTTPMVGCMGVGCNGIALQWPDLKGGHIQLHLIQTCGEHLSVGVGEPSGSRMGEMVAYDNLYSVVDRSQLLC